MSQTARASGLEIRGVATGLLDEPLLLSARGSGNEEGLQWRARYRDDDARVWQATADRARELVNGWAPAKGKGAGTAHAALQSLRPVAIEVRVESPDGRTASRSFTRRLLGDGVRVRRWRDGLTATLYLPPTQQPPSTVLIDATAGQPQLAQATLAAALLASRGVLALVVAAPGKGKSVDSALDTSRERLLAMPAASPRLHVVPVLLPPGVGVQADDRESALARSEIWDQQLHLLGAQPRPD